MLRKGTLKKIPEEGLTKTKWTKTDWQWSGIRIEMKKIITN